MDIVNAGRTLYLSEFPGAEPHLWLVLTDPAGTPESVVMVMLRSAKEYTDPTLILDVGDHPFIKHPTSVHYSTAQRFSVSQISNALQKGECTLERDMSPNLLGRARKGLLLSPYTVNALRNQCESIFS